MEDLLNFLNIHTTASCSIKLLLSVADAFNLSSAWRIICQFQRQMGAPDGWICFILQKLACYRWKSPVFPRMCCIKYSSLLRSLTFESKEIIDKVVLTCISEDFLFESIWDGYRSLSVMEKRLTRNFLFWLPGSLYLLVSHSLQFRQN